MVSRSLGVSMGVLALACTPARPPAPAPPRPVPVLVPDEPCAPDWPYGSLPPEELDDIYDELVKKHERDPYAEESPHDAADAKAAAKHAYEIGRKADVQGRREDAYRAFQKSWSLRKHAYTAYAIAKVAAALGRQHDVLRYTEFVLQSNKAQHAQRKDALEWRAKALRLVATLRITGAPQGACVLVNGLAVGNAPLRAPIPADGGIHMVSWRLAGDQAEIEVTVPVRGEVDVQLPAPER